MTENKIVRDKMPLVSVVVPIYNVELYLKECVDSILSQTYKNIEVILVDDESPDLCGKICDDYAAMDGRIKVVHKKNGGLSDARNAGIPYAKGEYIIFLDSDDYIENDIDLGICVDVFPFDYYADVNKEMVKLDTYRRLSVYTLYGIHSKNAGLKNIVRYLLVLVFRLTRVKTWNKKMNILSMQANDSDSIDYLMENKRTSTKFEKTLLDKVMDSPFEDRIYKIPEDSYQILSAIYGDDFMEIPPVEKRVKHDDFVAYIKEV